ncbi:stage V sporulation protein AA [Peribacillus butanolivorans]|uniref:stage V sporulation protein AA n=1 Tax=Peribacillus TaxID=2675229 RepID=UPI001911DDA8|nr:MULTISPECIES: stage V sporulation protein AA [unclassified Peribacillus]MBK5462828.1 stage V sporulation protein AA [Peribacillus sp. TH27]MBK5483830.1 stage V sporulation protein AA [Peribacillus sp. TH16]MBK5501011.1 stage V sporulation protein AA [Peribacillus sp. TH14]MBK5442422.1 stage V sporulation protein AA [Peribacillus sp. TH24]WMX58392.1 stage V sporulation protein AA [Peribacillus sp. R9-11]
MMAVVYIRMRNRVQVKGNQTVRIKDIARIIGPEEVIQIIEETFLLTVKKEDKNIIVIDLAQLIMAIRKVDPQIEVQTFGPSQTIIEVIYSKKKMSYLTFALVWFLLFIGAGMTIMNFHVDVSMGEVHQKVFTLITGKLDEKPLLIQIPYSFGLGIGMILFFNHFFKKRFNEEPSPLEVEMFNYQQDLDRYVTMNENKENVRHLDDR